LQSVAQNTAVATISIPRYTLRKLLRFRELPQLILHIIDSLQRTGTARQMQLLVRSMPHGQFESHVCALSDGGPIAEELTPAGCQVDIIGRRWPADPLAFRRLTQRIKEHRPDWIVGWQAAGRAYAAAAARLVHGPRLAAVWRSIESNQHPVQQTIDRFIGTQAEVVAATCPAVREHCIAHGIVAKKIKLISSGVETKSQPALTRGQLLARLGLPENARLVGWAARMERNRGGKDAIWAADLLKVIRDDVHLLIFGDGPYRDRLVRFRDQVEIADKVHLLGDRGDFDQILPCLDQFWSTGRRVGQPQAMLEAMAASVPVIAADVPGVRDLIAHEKTGYLFAPGHRAGIARWAEHLINNPDTARQIGAAGTEKVICNYSAETMVRQWTEVFGG
jgi:glycosyltransferase involved in cell wall biosynthesis